MLFGLLKQAQRKDVDNLKQAYLFIKEMKDLKTKIKEIALLDDWRNE